MASFGACREFALLHSNVEDSLETGSNPDPRCRIYVPQPNNCCISFGQDVNLHFKHAINALADNQQDGKGCINVLVWGWTENIVKENESPVVQRDPEVPQDEKKETEETTLTKKQRARRNVRRKNRRQNKGAAQKKDTNEGPSAEKTPENVVHA